MDTLLVCSAAAGAALGLLYLLLTPVRRLRPSGFFGPFADILFFFAAVVCMIMLFSYYGNGRPRLYAAAAAALSAMLVRGILSRIFRSAAVFITRMRDRDSKNSPLRSLIRFIFK